MGKSTDKKKAPLIAEVFSKINVGACVPLPISTQVNKYIIAVICLASKYPDLTSKCVVNAILQIFSRMGFPKNIQTDQRKCSNLNS